eukprot:COSAG01_NODE_64512_length_276_cov_0.672316_1_plen_26_part_10
MNFNQKKPGVGDRRSEGQLALPDEII